MPGKGKNFPVGQIFQGAVDHTDSNTGAGYFCAASADDVCVNRRNPVRGGSIFCQPVHKSGIRVSLSGQGTGGGQDYGQDQAETHCHISPGQNRNPGSHQELSSG